MTAERFHICCGHHREHGHAKSCATLRRAAVEEALGQVESAYHEAKAGDDKAAGGHLELAARALVHHDALANLRDVIEAGNRACDATIDGWVWGAREAVLDAHQQLKNWLRMTPNEEWDTPEPCECDQVQSLRRELSDARDLVIKYGEAYADMLSTVSQALDLVPDDVAHGGDIEKAVRLLVGRVSQSGGAALVRALRFAVNASGDETGLSDEERNALAKMVRGAAPA